MAYLLKVVLFNETQEGKNWSKGDSYFYLFMAESLVEDRDLNLSNNHGSLSLYEGGNFALSKFEYPTAKQSPLMTIASMPFYYVFGPVGTLWFNILCVIGIMFFIYKILNNWVSYLASSITVFSIAIGSVFLSYTFNYSPDIFSSFLLLWMLWSCFNNKWILTAVIGGISISTKMANVIVVAPILLFILWETRHLKSNERIKLFALVGLSFILSILPWLLYNKWLFGGFLTTGYQRMLAVDGTGKLTLLTHTSDFNVPILKGLWNLFFDTKRGLMKPNFLVIIPAIFGLFFIPKNKDKEKLILVLSIVLIQFAFYGKYDHQMATLKGNRFLLISIALMSLPSSWLVERILKRLNIFDSKHLKLE